MADLSTSLSLLERARHHNPEAWERMVFLYGPLVASWCRTWGLQGADIDDVRQEVFQAVAMNLGSFRGDRPGDTFRGWLRVITRGKFLDLCRRRERQPGAEGGSDAWQRLLQLPDAELSRQDDDPAEVSRLHHRALELIRSEFEERTWQAFWRCAVEERTPAEVGQEMQMSPAAVRQAKSRVLRRLKESFGHLLG